MIVIECRWLTLSGDTDFIVWIYFSGFRVGYPTRGLVI